MSPVSEKTLSIVLGKHREQCGCDNNSANDAHNQNEQQANPDPTTHMHQTVVMQYNDADRFLHDTYGSYTTTFNDLTCTLMKMFKIIRTIIYI